MNRPELGTFKPGGAGDASILSIADGEFDYVDVTGDVMRGDRKINADATVVAGKWWHPV